MGINKTDAVSIRRIDYSETSQVVVFYTRDFGKVHVIAKGAKRPRKHVSAAIDLVSYGELLFYPRSTPGLHVFSEFTVKETCPGLRADLARARAGFYLCELTGELCREEQANPAAFDLLRRALKSLASGADARRTVFQFELRLLGLTGFMPRLSRCCVCDGELEKGRWIPFDAGRGGSLCGKCRAGTTEPVFVSRGAVSVMDALARGGRVAPDRLRIPDQTAAEIRSALNAYISSIVHRELRTAKNLP